MLLNVYSTERALSCPCRASYKAERGLVVTLICLFSLGSNSGANMLNIMCRCMYCMVMYVMCGCVCDKHYVYVYMVEEKALGVFRVWQPI